MCQTERRQTIVIQGRDFNEWYGHQPASHFLIEAGRRPIKHYAMSVMKALHDNLYDTFTLKAMSKANIKVCYSVCSMVNHWITVKEIWVERATLWYPEKLLIGDLQDYIYFISMLLILLKAVVYQQSHFNLKNGRREV